MAFGHEHDERRRPRLRTSGALAVAAVLGATLLIRWPQPQPQPATAEPAGAHEPAETPSVPAGR